MGEVMKTLVTIATIMLFLIASYIAIMSYRDRSFRRFVKEGDPIKFFIGEESFYGHVKLLGRRYIHIKTLNSLPKFHTRG